MAEEKKVAQITCQSCGKTFNMYVPENGGICKVTCPHCQNVMTINFGTPKTAKSQQMQPRQSQSQPQENQVKDKTKDIAGGGGMKRGKLVQVRGFLRKNISYPLQIGDNTIGQYDLDMPSTIMVKDNTISRQSVNIKVDYDEGRLDYRFCLLKSKNPVLLNGMRIQVGEERYLKFGDTIVLGLTNFRFEKV